MANEGVKTGFAHPEGGTGPLYPSWNTLYDEFLGIIKNSWTNLDAIGKTLMFAAQAYAERDATAAQQLDDQMDGLPWQLSTTHVHLEWIHMTKDNDANTTAANVERVRKPRLLWIGGSVLAALLVAVIAFVVFTTETNEDPDANTGGDSAERCKDAAQDTGVDEPEAPPESGGIEVIEKGSAASRNLEPSASHNFGDLAAGVILKNTTDLVARNVVITMSAVWPDGHPANGIDEKPIDLKLDPIGFISPGDTIGAGDNLAVLNDHQGPGREFTINADIEVAEWWKSDNDVHDFAKLSAKIAKTERPHPYGDNDGIEISVTSESCVARAQATASGIVRNVEGDIIGGGYDNGVLLGNSKKYLEKFSPGTTYGLLSRVGWTAKDRPSEYDTAPDPSKTEIYPYLLVGDE